MDYFQLLNLSREPFSNSPDPEFFYPSPEHIRCLQRVELAIRLRRGLNVVVGPIGTGKTTLCRHLIREFAADETLESHLILNPDFSSPMEFLCSLAEIFGLAVPSRDENHKWQIEESIRNYLFRKGAEEEKVVLLLIDEGQKMAPFCLEILRELLNYETNEHKLLQIVIFAQEEFQQTLAEHPNFTDRINAINVLAPLSYRQTRNLLQFRLNQAKEGYKDPRLFTIPGKWALFLATKGYPRKIVHLSHRVLLTMIIQNRRTAGWFLVRWCSRMMLPAKRPKPAWRRTAFRGILAVLGLLLVLLAAFGINRWGTPFYSNLTRAVGIFPSPAPPPATPPPVAQRARIPEPAGTVATHRIPPQEEADRTAAETPQNETTPSPAVATPTQLPTEPTVTAAPSSPGEPPAAQPSPSTSEAPAPVPPPEAQTLGGDTTNTEIQPELRPGTQPDAPPETQPPAQPDIGPETPPDSTKETPVAEFHPPEVLGQVVIRAGDSLERMIRRIYGFYDQSLLKAVLQLNHHITDPNALEIGRAVKFPPVPVRAAPLPKEGRYVEVAQAATLNEACKLLRAYPADAPQVYLLPYWIPTDGLRFGLVLKDCCSTQQAAETTRGALPTSLATRARIIGREDDRAVFMVK